MGTRTWWARGPNDLAVKRDGKHDGRGKVVLLCQRAWDLMDEKTREAS